MSPAQLRKRIDELSLEIRHYPTPIARCDEQLAALLDERSRLLAQLDDMSRDGACGPEARWTNDGGMDAA